MNNLTPDQIAERALHQYWVTPAWMIYLSGALDKLFPNFIQLNQKRALNEWNNERLDWGDMFGGYVLISLGFCALTITLALLFKEVFHDPSLNVITFSYILGYILWESVFWRYKRLLPNEISEVAVFARKHCDLYWKEAIARWVVKRPLCANDCVALSRALRKKEAAEIRDTRLRQYEYEMGVLMDNEMKDLMESYREKLEHLNPTSSEVV
jgi:hypothetical protein